MLKKIQFNSRLCMTFTLKKEEQRKKRKETNKTCTIDCAMRSENRAHTAQQRHHFYFIHFDTMALICQTMHTKKIDKHFKILIQFVWLLYWKVWHVKCKIVHLNMVFNRSIDSCFFSFCQLFQRSYFKRQLTLISVQFSIHHVCIFFHRHSQNGIGFLYFLILMSLLNLNLAVFDIIDYYSTIISSSLFSTKPMTINATTKSYVFVCIQSIYALFYVHLYCLICNINSYKYA